LVASSGGLEKQQEMRTLLASDMGDSIIETIRHDCLAYESFHVEDPEKLRTPIFSMRGSHDNIAGDFELKSWKQVAGSKWEYREIKNSGHMLAVEAPSALANYIIFASLLDIPDELGEFTEFRGKYGLLRQILRGKQPKQQAGEINKMMRQVSPVLGAKMIPLDSDGLQEFTFSLKELDGSEIVAAQTAKVKQMRQGNLQWRLGESKGNPLPQVH
jgi:hypothetical protein